MADVNAPADQAPTMAPPTRTDDQIKPHIRWVPIGKSNCYLDVEKSQSNPIYKIVVDILKHTNFYRAYIASLTIQSIYIQQFWDTIRYDKTTRCYKCQLDEQWFDLTKDTLRDALQITPVNNNKAFSSPTSSDALINFVNDLGYPKVVRNLFNVVTNDMFQPSRGLTTIINLCLMGKTLGFERPRALVLQILWDKKNLAHHTYEKKKATRVMIPSIRFTKLIIYYLQRKHKFHSRTDSPLHLPNEEPVLGYLKFSAKGTNREVFGMPIPGNLITADIQGKPYYQEYLEKVAKNQRYLASEQGSDPDSPASKPAKTTKKSKPSVPKADPRPPVTKSASSQQPEPKHAPAKSKGKKCKLVTETSDKPSLARRSKPGLVTKQHKPTSSLRSVDESVAEGIPEKEPRFDDEEADVQRALEESLKSIYDAPQGLLPPVVIREPESGKCQPLPKVQGKGKEKVTDEQATSTPTRSSGHDESSSLYAELGLTDNEVDSDEDVPGINAGVPDEGQAGPNLGDQDEGQAGPNPNEQVILEEPTSSTGTLPSLQHLANDLSFGDLFFNDKPSEADNEKKTTKTKAGSMPLQATTTKTITTTTTIHPPPPQPQQSTIDSMLMKCIDELEHIMANLIQDNKHLEERSLKYLVEARKKKKKIRDLPKTPPGSPPHQPPLPLPPAGPSGTSGSLRASGSSQVPPTLPPPLSTNHEGQLHGSIAPSSSKTAASAEYKAWIITDTRLRLSVTLTPEDLQMDDDMAPDAQAHSSDDEDIRNAHIPKYQMEECHKLLTDSVDDSIIRHNVSKPLPLGGPPNQVIIQSDFFFFFFFNKDLEYLRYGSRGSRPALSISKIKAAYYPNVVLERMVPDQMWIDEECKYDIAAIAVRTHMHILNVVRIKVFSMYGCDYMKKIILHREDLNEHIITVQDFKYLYLSDFEDLYLLNI
uniref:Monodehydroascorbate reductase n=1 Tax=Tanacetum cinerariifolium TaxID=118510 RepID=A0A6L2MBQ3_TANCI|nr:monodehydroascorbate reductase [Tanacetum cinerariifolium]